jgi:hypothetical protein
MKELFKLFCAGFMQVFLIAVNTYCIAKEIYFFMVPSGFLISFLWTYNVKRISIGKMVDRVVYSSGAVTGNILGVLLIKFLYGLSK